MEAANWDISLPYRYDPRPYQMPFWRAFDSGLYNRFVQVWHRRAGKDITDLNLAVREAAKYPQTITIAYPTLKMGREILWEGMDNDGNRFIDYYIPRRLIAGRNDTRMTIHFKNGSIIRIAGSDNPDSLRGGNSKGFIISEWAEHDPYTWTVIRPIVRANKGWVVFNYTPKGDNHGKTTLEMAKRLAGQGWWWQVLPADKTGVFTAEELKQELAELIQEHGESEGRAKFDQEYNCSFDSPVVGAYYGAQMRLAAAEDRICSVPYEGGIPVHTFWDLGVGDSNAIWLLQLVGREVHAVDYIEASGVGVEHYANDLNKKPYAYGTHWGPHDIENREWGSGQSRKETAANFGINFQTVPRMSVDDGIQAVRNLLSRCVFDEKRCERGISALKNYQRDYDRRNKVYRPYPKHNWASHGSDAFRYAALALPRIGNNVDYEDDFYSEDQVDLTV